MNSRKSDALQTYRSLIECMNGTLSIQEGIDLTEPSWPDWETHFEQKYGPYSELGVLLAAAVPRQNSGKASRDKAD